MRCIACSGLLGLCEQGLFVPNEPGAKSDALVGDGPQPFDIESRGRARQLNDGVSERDAARSLPLRRFRQPKG
jgi:hypothetical protein